MASEDQAEEHLIGSLMDSLGKGGEDDVFKPTSDVPEIPDAQKNPYDHLLLSQQNQVPFYQQPSAVFAPQFWAPPQNSANAFWMQQAPAGPPPPRLSTDQQRYLHRQAQELLAARARSQMQQSYFQPRPDFSPQNCYRTDPHLAAAAHLSYLQNPHYQHHQLQAVQHQFAVQQQAQQPQPQWESIYTPFGPMKTKNAHSASDETKPNTEAEKKRSASVSTPSVTASSISSSSAGSPSLPPKGRSYRDAVNKSLQKSKCSEKTGQQKSSSTPSSDVVQRKYSGTVASAVAAGRESSSDSLSEFGGSECEKLSAVENYVTGYLDKKRKSEDVDEEENGQTELLNSSSSSSAEKNMLKKNVTTATSTTDFQKITGRRSKNTGSEKQRQPQQKQKQQQQTPARKTSTIKISVEKNSEISTPILSTTTTTTGAGRYDILSSKSPMKTSKNEPTCEDRKKYEISTPKLNNEQTAARLDSKSPTRKAAYINNDLSWPNEKCKKNNNGPYFENDDDEEDDYEEEEEFLEDEEEFLEEEEENWRLLDRGIPLNLNDEDRDEDEEILNNSLKTTNKETAKNDQQILIKRQQISAKNVSTNAATSPGNLGQKTAAKKAKNKRGDSDLVDRYGNRKRRQQRGPVALWFHMVLTAIACYVRDAAVWLLNLVTDIGNQLLDITVYCSKVCYTKASTSAQCAWYKTGERLRKLILSIRQKEWSILLWWRARRKRKTVGKDDTLGLDDNIDLPTTGDEAMKRLLSCRGQDAYSILGLRPDCTDDEIKCYYRRQAVLVHPDKNACYGADEAFKILAAAFELIGTSQQRQQYDLENLHRTKAMKELEKMFAKLKEKMDEVKSTMHCDCGGKHKRFPTERPLAYARYCRKCKEKHCAREGDIWAESHWFGFLWYYYACMEGVVYDITEWAGCQKNNLKHMKPDTHLVQYRLITGRNARQFPPSTNTSSLNSTSSGQQHQGGSSQQYNRSASDTGSSNANAAAAEEFISRFLESRWGGGASTSASAPSTSMHQPASPSTSSYGSGVDFSSPTQPKFHPPSFAHGDSRPRKAGRRRKPRL